MSKLSGNPLAISSDLAESWLATLKLCFVQIPKWFVSVVVTIKLNVSVALIFVSVSVSELPRLRFSL